MAKVIVIEDEGDFRELIVGELKDAGYETLEAVDGAAGLSAIIAQRPDVIISDVGMPNMNGFELKRRLQRLPQLRPTPFLFLTALAFDHSIEQGKASGADEYLIKPVDFDCLLSKVGAFVANPR